MNNKVTFEMIEWHFLAISSNGNGGGGIQKPDKEISELFSLNLKHATQKNASNFAKEKVYL